MHWLSRCNVFYFREPTFPTKSLMEPSNITPGSMGWIPALNIECSRSLARSLGDAAAWETPPHGRCSLSLARRRSVPSLSLFDTLGHDGPEAQSHSAGPREADSMSQRAQSPAAQSPAAQWLNAPSEAHPGSCRPCWFTAKGKGCHRNGCLFCHKPHVTADVRHPGGRYRQRVATRNGRDDMQCND